MVLDAYLVDRISQAVRDDAVILDVVMGYDEVMDKVVHSQEYVDLAFEIGSSEGSYYDASEHVTFSEQSQDAVGFVTWTESHDVDNCPESGKTTTYAADLGEGGEPASARFIIGQSDSDEDNNGTADEDEPSLWESFCSWLFGDGITYESEAGHIAAMTVTHTVDKEFGASLVTLVDKFLAGTISSTQLKSSVTSTLSVGRVNTSLTTAFPAVVLPSLGVTAAPQVRQFACVDVR